MQIAGTLDGFRAFDIFRTYLEPFMDFDLKGREERMLDGPSSPYLVLRI